MTHRHEYREVTEVWDGQAWVILPSAVFSPAFINDTSVEKIQELVTTNSQARAEHPAVGQLGPIYLERREVGEWERV